MGHFEPLFHDLRSLRMSDLEKQQRKAALLDAMLAFPERHTSWLHRHLVAGFVLMLLVVGTEVSLIAESAVPGDLVYPIKVQVTERVLDVVELSTEDQISWDISKAERRQAEAEAIALQNGF